MIAITTGAAIGLAVNAAPARSVRVAHPVGVAGLVIMWLGLAIRVWAIAMLGRDFRTTVGVDPGQAVVSPAARTRASAIPPTPVCS